MKEIELKPCPVCGSTDLEINTYHRFIGVYCRNPSCPRTCTSYYRTKKAAINAWNRRDDETDSISEGL